MSEKDNTLAADISISKDHMNMIAISIHYNVEKLIINKKIISKVFTATPRHHWPCMMLLSRQSLMPPNYITRVFIKMMYLL